MAKNFIAWTHAGQFHADEVSAIALLHLFHPDYSGYVRSFEKLNKRHWENIISVDIGREFDGVTKFDHHHDENLEAACVLIGDWLVSLGHLRKEVWDMMYRGMFQYMSKVDRGIIPGGGDSHSINALIRNLNCSYDEEDGFLDALIVMESFIKGAHRNISEALEEDKNWNGFKKHQGVVEMKDKKCRRWKMFASKESIRYAVCVDDRDASKGTLISRDAEQWPIPAHDKQTFLHNSRFLAVYESYEDALDHALELNKESELT